jgi:NAD(P)-dependent dehydrogenase (short-subunit alcohol dehydrogenase family)
MMHSLPESYRAIVFGASGAIGGAFVRALSADPRCARIYVGARTRPEVASEKTVAFTFDLKDEASIEGSLSGITADGPVHLIVIATGILHDAQVQPEKTWRAIGAGAMSHAYAINTIGPSLIAKHALALLPRDQRALFAALSARVGSIEDNRLGGWHSYRASKAALNMMMRCFAIELSRRAPQSVCACLHPGTVDSDLSKPFRSGVHTLFTPDQAATALLKTLDGLQPADSGGLFAYDGARIPF